VKYRAKVTTGKKFGGGTDANVFLDIFGTNGDTGKRELRRSETYSNKFEVGHTDEFIIEGVLLVVILPFIFFFILLFLFLLFLFFLSFIFFLLLFFFNHPTQLSISAMSTRCAYRTTTVAPRPAGISRRLQLKRAR
jgi:hypothetical protein